MTTKSTPNAEPRPAVDEATSPRPGPVDDPDYQRALDILSAAMQKLVKRKMEKEAALAAQETAAAAQPAAKEHTP
jgi:hypothetical protein